MKFFQKGSMSNNTPITETSQGYFITGLPILNTYQIENDTLLIHYGKRTIENYHLSFKQLPDNHSQQLATVPLPNIFMIA